jgi:DNA-binding transcriptional ArsR family regulator
MAADYESLGEMLKALAHPARLRIVEGLLKDECNVGQIQKRLGLPQSTISQHLRILKSVGIIRGRKEGTRTCYRVIDTRARKVVSLLRGE